jgi:hypothetical protein
MYLGVYTEDDTYTPAILITLCDKGSTSEPVKMDMYGLLKLRTFLSKLRNIQAMRTFTYTIAGGTVATYKYLADKDIRIGSTLSEEPAIHITSFTAERLYNAINIVYDFIDRNRSAYNNYTRSLKQQKEIRCQNLHQIL